MVFIIHNAGISLLPPPPGITGTPDWIWPRIFLFFTLWWTVYWALLRLTMKDPEYCCRFITLIHGIGTVYLTLKDITAYEQQFDLNCKIPLTPYQIYFLSITISYFMYDLLWINMFGAESMTIHLHHVFSILLLLKIITSDTGGPGVSYGLFGLEVTNPYLQARWFLRTHGYHNKPIHKAVELWFIFSFITIRIIGGTTLLYYVEINPHIDVLLKISFIGIYFVSWLLIVQILQFFKKKYLYGSQPLLSSSVLSLFPYRRRGRSQPRSTADPVQEG